VSDPAGNPNAGSDTAAVTYVHSGTLQFSSPTYAINERGAPTLHVTVTRLNGDEGQLTVQYAAADGSAHFGTDYGTPSGTGTLTWADQDTTGQTFDIPILDDGGLGSDEDFSLALSGINLSGALGTPTSAAVTVFEEAGLTLGNSTFGPFSQNGSSPTANIVVQRLSDSHGPVTVHYSTADGIGINKAVAGRDYTTTDGTLTWVDGDATAKTIRVPLLDDGKSHGVEEFTLSLDAAGGNAVLGDTIAATVRIDKNHGVAVPGVLPRGQKLPAPFTDTDGDAVTIRLGGKAAGSSLTYYLTDGVGPISEIDLAGTDPTKSTVTITVTKPKGADATHGTVGVGEVDGTGFKSFTARSADLTGAGFNLTSFAGTIRVGNVSNGADFLLPGLPPAPKSAVSITAGVIGDGTDITVAAPIKSFTAIAVGHGGTITAPSVGSITVKGRRASKTLSTIAGNFGSNVTISGVGVDPVKGKALKTFKVAGTVSDATVSVGGNVGAVTVGSFLTSELFAGYTGPDDGTGQFTGAFAVGPFVTRATAHGFADSYVIATNIKNVTLASADTADGGVPFGFDFHGTFGGLTVRSPKLSYDKAAGGSQILEADFEVKKV
jgi:hypothetical protein